MNENTVDIYEYIANSNPQGCINVLSRYGSDVQSIYQLPGCMRRVVADKGAEPFMELLKLHPDKEVIVDSFGSKETCKDCVGNFKNFMNANGSSQASPTNNPAMNANSHIAGQTQLLIIGSIVIISLALIFQPGNKS